MSGWFLGRQPLNSPISAGSAKIARCAWCSDGDFRRSPRSACNIADIWHLRYRRLNSPAFAKCSRSCDFLRSSLRIATKVNQSGWAILSHEFSKWRTRTRKMIGYSLEMKLKCQIAVIVVKKIA